MYPYFHRALLRQLLLSALCPVLLVLGTTAAQAGDSRETNTASGQQFNSGANQVSLVELYTSEGCSSCPPADRWLSQLGRGKAIWRTVVPVAFHVSYWDRLGWPDRFAQRKFDTRQRLLAARADAGVYTPGLFYNGAEFRSWRRTPPRSIPPAAANDVGDLQLHTTGGGEWRVTFTPALHIVDQATAVFVAVLGNELNNDVRRGENAGKVLEHDFVVLDLHNAPLKPASSQGGDALEASFVLDTSITARPALAAWVVDANGAPLQAVGGEVTSPETRGRRQSGSQAGG